MRRSDLVAFLGPSLPLRTAERIARCTVLPPARQGDVWRALRLGPRAIALVDGLFESQPSVWHREILDALASGVAVFGGGSMGALRAAELRRFGMVGVGEIFAAYRDGRLLDDGEVALLHAGPEHGWRPFTVPLVNVRWAAARARANGVLTGVEAADLAVAAERVFYMDRTWPVILDQVSRRWRPGCRVRWDRFAAAGLPDLKANDARATVTAAASFVRSAPPPVVAAPPPPASSLVRRRKLAGAPGSFRGSAADRAALVEGGLRRALLAGLARSLGLAVPPEGAAGAAARGRRDAGAPRLSARLARQLGFDDVDAARLADDRALERVVLSEAARMVPDGPSPLEAFAAESRRLALSRAARPGRARRAGPR